MRIIILCLIAISFISCQKKQCYECKFYDMSLNSTGGVHFPDKPSDVEYKCGYTEGQINKFVKTHEDRTYPNDNTIICDEDKMWVICTNK